jgi:hypothetical protein
MRTPKINKTETNYEPESKSFLMSNLLLSSNIDIAKCNDSDIGAIVKAIRKFIANPGVYSLL